MDPELEAIKAKRLSELKQEQGEVGNEEAQQKQLVAENARQNALVHILTNDARERLSRIALVKAERARAIENLLINGARNGTIRGGNAEDGRLNEVDLVNLINQLEQGSKKPEESKIKFQRRTYSDDEDF